MMTSYVYKTESFYKMSNLLHFTVRHTSNLLKAQYFRLFSKSVTLSQNINSVDNALFKNVYVLYAYRKFCMQRFYDINTSISKDVILYKYENARFYNMLNFFAISQFVFWTYLSHFAFTTLKDAPVDQNPEVELKWYQRINLGENKYRNGISICCFLMGYGILVAAWMFTLRSVRFLILRKGGKELSFVTYAPFNTNRIMTVPLNCVSAQEARELARVQLPIKVKNKLLHYMLDMRGEFRNPQLFDYTAGLKRRIQN